jgi:hypothetical protein
VDALVSLAIYKEVTGLQPVMWGPSIIGFGSIHYVYETGRECDMPATSAQLTAHWEPPTKSQSRHKTRMPTTLRRAKKPGL